jgi:S-adenosylmethionine:tRNA ribosyltransferase-isomerase
LLVCANYKRMELPDYINIHDYNYILPEERIARFPLDSRDSSKLLYYCKGKTESWIFSDLPELLTNHHHLVFNDTRVIQARLQFHKTTGSAIEIFLLEPFLPAEYTLSFSSKLECTWKCLVGNAKKWKNEVLQMELKIGSNRIILKAEKTGREGNYFLIRLSWDNETLIFSSVIEHAGSTPIPPYLNREAVESDHLRYQTVYSLNEGSVAAPTAGLHFTADVIKKLENKGVSQTRLTLHVGAGTFVPVKTVNAREHEMHTEHIYLNRGSLDELYRSGKKFIAVGTTSVRTLESLYHIAAKIKQVHDGEKVLFLDQWEAYENVPELSRKESLEIILSYMQKLKTDSLKVSTRIMITPGYKFRMVDGIITNFHQPASTLLLLISAFVGGDWKKIYAYALQNQYRFLSYGDGSLLIR